MTALRPRAAHMVIRANAPYLCTTRWRLELEGGEVAHPDGPHGAQRAEQLQSSGDPSGLCRTLAVIGVCRRQTFEHPHGR